MALSDSIWWTRKARIRSEKRLLSNAFQSQVLLLWYSFFSVAVSVYYLKSSQSDIGSVSWIVYSVLVLVISGFINGLSFKERANLIKECYEGLNSLYQQVNLDGINIKQVAHEYEQALNACENHTDEDYAIALCQENWSSTNPESDLDRAPTSYHIYTFSMYFLKRYFLLGFFYLLPLLIMCVLNFIPFETSNS